MRHPGKAIVLTLTSAILIAAVACGDGDSSANPTSTPGAMTTTPDDTPITTAPSPATPASGVPNESGESPVYWRTMDDFASVVAGEPYLVLFRIESAYNETSLSVTAACTTCAAADDLTFVGTNSPPVGQDSPGAYYPMNMTFSQAGHWELTVHAGADEVMIPVDVRPAS